MENKKHQEKFNEESLHKLESSWEAGMTSASKQCQQMIVDVSVDIGVSSDKVKTWIGNRRRKDLERKVSKKVLKRGPSGYSLFARNIKRGTTDGSNYLKEISRQWNSLTSLEREDFSKRASDVRSDPLKGNSKAEVVKQQLHNIQQAINILENVGYNLGGYGCGMNGEQPVTFYTKNTFGFFNKLEDFQKFVCPATESSSQIDQNINDSNSKQQLRKLLRNHWNNCWKTSTGKDTSVPYKEIDTKYIVIGMPPNIKFDNPSNFGKQQMQTLLDTMITFELRPVTEVVDTNIIDISTVQADVAVEVEPEIEVFAVEPVIIVEPAAEVESVPTLEPVAAVEPIATVEPVASMEPVAAVEPVSADIAKLLAQVKTNETVTAKRRRAKRSRFSMKKQKVKKVWKYEQILQRDGNMVLMKWMDGSSSWEPLDNVLS